MKRLVLVIFLLNVGCSTTRSYAPGAPPVCRKTLFSSTAKFEECKEQQKKAEVEYAARKAEQEKLEREQLEAQDKASKAGTSIAEYVAAFGEPKTKEIIEGADVYWYDSNPPMFVIFKKGKLVSKIVDRDTMEKRYQKYEKARLEAREDKRLKEQARQEKRDRIGKALSNSNYLNRNSLLCKQM